MNFVKPQPGAFKPILSVTLTEEDDPIGLTEDSTGFELLVKESFEYGTSVIDRPNLPTPTAATAYGEALGTYLITRRSLQELDDVHHTHARAKSATCNPPLETLACNAQGLEHFGHFKFQSETFATRGLHDVAADRLMRYLIKAKDIVVNDIIPPNVHHRATSYVPAYFTIAPTTGELMFRTSKPPFKEALNNIAADLFASPLGTSVDYRLEFARHLMDMTSYEQLDRFLNRVDPAKLGRTAAQLRAAIGPGPALPTNNHLRDLLRHVFGDNAWTYPVQGADVEIPLPRYRQLLNKGPLLSALIANVMRIRASLLAVPKYQGGQPSMLASYPGDTAMLSSRAAISAADATAAVVLDPGPPIGHKFAGISDLEPTALRVEIFKDTFKM